MCEGRRGGLPAAAQAMAEQHCLRPVLARRSAKQSVSPGGIALAFSYLFHVDLQGKEFCPHPVEQLQFIRSISDLCSTTGASPQM